VLYLGAALSVLYLTLRYIIPFLLRVIAGILGVMVQVAFVLLAVFGILWLVGYISRSSRS
jgi:hypothetical protein